MIANIECLEAACVQLGIPYHFVHTGDNFVSVNLGKRYYFVNCTTPFNSQDVSRICLDKDFTQKLLENTVAMPKTLSFLDPQYTEFNIVPSAPSIEHIVDSITKTLGLPVVIKMNSGSRRRNVYKCFTPYEVQTALGAIYNQNSKDYDFLALAQEMVDIDREYRVVVFNQKVHLVYEKYTFVPMRELPLITKISRFLEPIYQIFDVKYGGIDLAINRSGELVLLEINSSPRFGPYIKHNGNAEIIEFYKKLLIDLGNRQ
jgi:glutathione synthase/RimK-type ligase-like ATP-grasp enzyme